MDAVSMLAVVHRYLIAFHAQQLAGQYLRSQQDRRFGVQKSQAIAKLPYRDVAVPLAKDSSLHRDVAPPAQMGKEEHGAPGDGCRTEDLRSQGRYRRLGDRSNRAKHQKSPQQGQSRAEQ